MDRGWDVWMEGDGGGVAGLPSSKCGDRDRWRPLADRVSPSFHLRPHGKNPPSSHMRPYVRPWNARATLQRDEGCALRRGFGGKDLGGREGGEGRKAEKRVRETAI